jgi:LAS superfamily LD-carboxypeptidase LdcB
VVDDAEDLGPGEAPEDTGDGNVKRLQPRLKQALASAQEDAAEAGLTILVNSGWRSAEHQAQLYQEAIAKYGSPEKARRWVLPPGESRHVTGEAIDVGPAAAAAWLEANGARYGLCRIYANEPWHFELRTVTPEGTCPALLPHA